MKTVFQAEAEDLILDANAKAMKKKCVCIYSYRSRRMEAIM